MIEIRMFDTIKKNYFGFSKENKYQRDLMSELSCGNQATLLRNTQTLVGEFAIIPSASNKQYVIKPSFFIQKAVHTDPANSLRYNIPNICLLDNNNFPF